VKICVLLEKERPRDLRADWTGFRIPDAFVVGYGLDLDGRYRNLRDIWTLE
jgi:hypoxanthine phosphoribosyltransferase